MAAVALRARAELRSRLRSWLGLALLVGLVAGIVMAATAGARRTDSAYERFLVEQRAADVFVDNYPDPGVGTVDPKAVERLPQVESAAHAAFLFIGEVGALAPADARLGRDVNRLKLLDGRLPAQHRVDEIAVGFERAERLGWGLGTTIPLVPPRYAAEAKRAGVPNIRLRVTAIVAAPGDFPPLVEQGRPSIYLTRAFHRSYAGTPLFEEGAGHAVLARLRRGAADVPGFRAGVERLTRGEPSAVSAEAEHARHVERSLGLQAAALRVLAALVALTGLVILSQTLARHAFLEAGEHDTLRALGMTRPQLFAVAMVRAVIVGAIGAVIALIAAAALSALAPLGSLARTAEPDPGLAIDGSVLALGAPATVLITLLLTAPSAWLAARGVGPRSPGGGGTAPAALLTRLDLRIELRAPARHPSALRLELGPGADELPLRPGPRPPRAPRVRTRAGDRGVLHRLDRPAAERERPTGRRHRARPRPRLRAPADRRGPRAGRIGRGRPRREDDARAEGRHRRRRARPPPRHRLRRHARGGPGRADSGGSSSGRLGQGAILLHRDVQRMARGVPAADAVLRLRPGTDRRALLKRLRRRLDDLYVIRCQQPLDIVDFGRVRGLPLIIAGLMATLAAATLAHVLMTAVRRRRRDLAVLKTLGFVRGQLRTIVLAQSLTYASAAVLIGLPLGVAAGRFAWNVYADAQGIVEEVIVPLPALLVAIPTAALVAAGIALVPARTAAATKPATVLRVE